MTKTSTPPAELTEFIVLDLACVRGGRILFSGLGFHLGAGGAQFVTGPNGIGKSSLLRVLAGLLAPASGTVRLTGTNPVPAYLGEGEGLKPLATVGESLAFWAYLQGFPDALARENAITDALARFALEDICDLPCRYLSTGQRQRVALARVLASDATLWLLDEPTNGLDEAGTHAFEQALAHHRAGGGMAVIATHTMITADGAQTLEMAHFTGDDPALADTFSRGLTVDEEA